MFQVQASGRVLYLHVSLRRLCDIGSLFKRAGSRVLRVLLAAPWDVHAASSAPDPRVCGRAAFAWGRVFEAESGRERGGLGRVERCRL